MGFKVELNIQRTLFREVTVNHYMYFPIHGGEFGKIIVNLSEFAKLQYGSSNKIIVSQGFHQI